VFREHRLRLGNVFLRKQCADSLRSRRAEGGSVPSSVEKEKRRNLLLSKQGPHNEDGGLRREGSYHDQG
jgi:hypothetical protein